MSSVEDWVEDKLQEGAGKDALKEVLREKGYDPDKVDEVAQETQQASDGSDVDTSEDIESENQESMFQDTSDSAVESSSSGLRNLFAVLALFLISLALGLFASGTVSL